MTFELSVYFESESIYNSTHDGLDDAMNYLNWTRATYFSRKIIKVEIKLE